EAVIDHAAIERLGKPANGDESPSLRRIALGRTLPADEVELSCCHCHLVNPRTGGRPQSGAEVGHLEDLFPHIDRRLQHAFLLKNIDQRLIGVQIRVIEFGEWAQIRLGQEIKLIRADRRVGPTPPRRSRLARARGWHPRCRRPLPVLASPPPDQRASRPYRDRDPTLAPYDGRWFATECPAHGQASCP